MHGGLQSGGLALQCLYVPIRLITLSAQCSQLGLHIGASDMYPLTRLRFGSEDLFSRPSSRARNLRLNGLPLNIRRDSTLMHFDVELPPVLSQGVRKLKPLGF